MEIKVAYLGGSRGQTGCAEECLTLHEGACVQNAIDSICERHPAIIPHLGSVRWALNFDFVDEQTPLQPGDELALLPPVQGGAPRVWVTEDALELDRVVQGVRSDAFGAIVVFLGCVRNHNRGVEVESLQYEAYVPMVERQLEKIIESIEQENSATRLAIAHRYGALEIGDISVLIAAASAHREPAFDAARQAIERIKVDVPIFKQEKTKDGETWIGWGGG